MDPNSASAPSPAAPEPKPGDTVAPSLQSQVIAPSPSDAVQDVSPTVVPPVLDQTPTPPVESQSPQQAQQTQPRMPAVPTQPERTYQDIDEASSNPQDAFQPQAAEEAVTWTASEFIAHNKSSGWYMRLAGVTLLIAATIFLLTRDKISTSVVIVAGIALGGYGARQPRQLTYALSDNGLMIASKYFPFEVFRSFSVVDEGKVGSIVFMPLKRFGQSITVYYDLAMEEEIVDILESRLPIEKRNSDLVDQLMRRIRF